MADHARHAAGLLDTLGIGAAHWVGHSSSCLIGLQLAQDRPDLVASLSLLEPAPGGDLHGPADERFVATTVGPTIEAFRVGDPHAACPWRLEPRWCPRPDTHLTYMIDIALTKEFALSAGGGNAVRRAARIEISRRRDAGR